MLGITSSKLEISGFCLSEATHLNICSHILALVYCVNSSCYLDVPTSLILSLWLKMLFTPLHYVARELVMGGGLR